MEIGSGITIENGISIVQTQTSTSNATYDFTTFTFSTAGVLGPGAGNLTTYKSFYDTANNSWLNDTNFYNVVRNGYQLWTVPKTGTYEIEAAGARSGRNGYVAVAGGAGFSNGAIIRAQVNLTQGDKLNLIAGQPAQNTNSNGSYNGGAGGGGSFVVANTNSTPILIAGGAGGAGRYSGYSGGTIYLGLDGNLGTAGANSRTFGEPGGTLGSGGKSHTLYATNSYDGGAGGGFLTNGQNGNGTTTANTATSQTGGGGLSYANNLTGGAFATSFAGQAISGGFGGGGGSSPINGAGGGGYSGGAGTSGTNGTSSDGAGGGGSFIIATATNVATSNGTFEKISTFNGAAITNLGTYNSGGGYIKITFIQ
jgi:hypothetical protein